MNVFRAIRITFTIIIISISLPLFSQIVTENTGDLYWKGRFSISLGGMMYVPASNFNTEGSLSPENKIIPNFQVGVGYDIFRNQKTDLTLFFNTNPEPVYKFRFAIPMEELPNEDSSHDLISHYKIYTMYSMNVGMMVRRQIMENRFGNFSVSGGYTLKYFPSGYSRFILTTSYDDLHVVLYDMYIESQENPLHHSIQLGIGQSFTFHRNYLNVDLYFNYKFSDLMDGEYKYYNLKTMTPSYGRYRLSGNFFGLQITYRRLKKI